MNEARETRGSGNNNAKIRAIWDTKRQVSERQRPRRRKGSAVARWAGEGQRPASYQPGAPPQVRDTDRIRAEGPSHFTIGGGDPWQSVDRRAVNPPVRPIGPIWPIRLILSPAIYPAPAGSHPIRPGTCPLLDAPKPPLLENFAAFASFA